MTHPWPNDRRLPFAAVAFATRCVCGEPALPDRYSCERCARRIDDRSQALAARARSKKDRP